MASENRLVESVEVFVWFGRPDSILVFEFISPAIRHLAVGPVFGVRGYSLVDLPVGETRRQGGIIDHEFFDATNKEGVVCDKSEDIEIELVA